MYIDYYNAIETQIKSYLNKIETIDWFNNQYKFPAENKYDPLPAVYIEFESPMAWTDKGNGMQTAETEITFHIVVKKLKDNPQIVLITAQELHLIIQRLILKKGDIQLSTELTRTNSKLNTFDQIKTMELTYKTTLFDCSAVAKTETVEIGFKILKKE